MQWHGAFMSMIVDICMRSIGFVLGLFFITPFVYAGEMGARDVAHPFYIGGNAGYGSTTWKALVPTPENQSIVLTISTPVDVHEGGGVWGGVVGFDFTSFFGVEANYLLYPKAEIFFDADSLFAFENDGKQTFSTKTQTFSLMAKFMVPVLDTRFRLYSALGPGWVHRGDEIHPTWLVTPSFGAGLSYPIAPHVMGEFAANYISGYGESEISPANDYVPFLYSVYFRLAYRV